MKTDKLNKNIITILEDSYVIPLYQRNFAWGYDEISQLLRDIYESFKLNQDGYYIGSLIVKKREGQYEVIDGQQRLTAITIMAKILDPARNDPELFYDSRPEVMDFFSKFYQGNETIETEKVSHLIKAIDFIKETKLNSDEKNIITINDLITKDDLIEKLKEFKTFFFNKVTLVFVELPPYTNVENYFEIMNNRGQQLQKYEILKAKLLNNLKEQNKYDEVKQKIYSKIWDACSQMNYHIQKLFDTDDRKNDYKKNLFGTQYESFPTKDKIDELIRKLKKNSDIGKFKSSEQPKPIHIDSILEQNEDNHLDNGNNDPRKDKSEDKSIIDFPNFLMHILKLLKFRYNELCDIDIPLDEKHLLKTFDKIEEKIGKIDPEIFIIDLLYYRTIFDRYIIKATTTTNEKSEEEGDKFEWTLKKPCKYEKSFGFKNTFEGEQEKIIKCLSMLQVTFRAREHKNWLQEVLSWFKNGNTISEKEYSDELDRYILKYYNEKIAKDIDNDIEDCSKYYAKGTGTPHFLFNFIDYLYWIKYSDTDKKKNQFDFRYRNSIEHHLPKSYIKKDGYPENLIHSLGNLCLVSGISNSRMKDAEPTAKIRKINNIDLLPPKRREMYKKTKEHSRWDIEEVKEHYKEVAKMLIEKKIV